MRNSGLARADCCYEGFEVPAYLGTLVSSGYGAESNVIRNQAESAYTHFIIPFSRNWANPDFRFSHFKQQWEEETRFTSSLVEICFNPNYQKIIGMGQTAVPLILRDLKSSPNHWFWALRSITGEDPILPEHHGNMELMTKDWLDWADRKKVRY